MRAVLLVSTLLAISIGTIQTVSAAGGKKEEPAPRPTATETQDTRTPEQQAIDHYNWGIDHRDRAWSLEKTLAEAPEGKSRAKAEKKIRSAYRKARAEFETAVAANPRMHQAHSDLGYCLRKLGEYEASLDAYGRALALAPGYPEAVEYRAEAYLALHRLEEVKDAYNELLGGAREYADQLMEAMVRFLDERGKEPAGIDPETLEAFSAWVAQRQELARQVKPISALPERRW